MKTKAMSTLLVIVMGVAIGVMINGQARAASMITGSERDMTVAMMVATKISHDPLLHEMPIGVSDYEGRITLSGAVYTQQQKDRATQEARSVNGVKKVNNLLEVVEPRVKS